MRYTANSQNIVTINNSDLKVYTTNSICSCERVCTNQKKEDGLDEGENENSEEQ